MTFKYIAKRKVSLAENETSINNENIEKASKYKNFREFIFSPQIFMTTVFSLALILLNEILPQKNKTLQPDPIITLPLKYITCTVLSMQGMVLSADCANTVSKGLYFGLKKCLNTQVQELADEQSCGSTIKGVRNSRAALTIG